MPSPQGREFVTHGQEAVGMLGDETEGEVIGDEGMGQGRSAEAEEHEHPGR